MSNKKIITSFLLLLVILSSIFAYGNQNKGYGKNQGGQVYQLYDDTQVNHQQEIGSYPVEELSQEEIDGLLLMREEEKLARDVYLELYDIWGQQIFLNIANSESTHTNALKLLLDKYNLTDPVTNDTRGAFTNQDLAELYTVLVEKGSVSLLDALIVGATVEDLDISDLKKLNGISDNQDITAVYNNLEKGSRNHLRSFTRVIEQNDGIYEPQYISESEYNEIISSEMETGTGYSANSAVQTGQSNQYNASSSNNESKNVFERMWQGFMDWFR
ncbi:DUF2202 domain-containing protein [Methanococcus maripaludis]|uniref:DUF2202 domain-containing protein n=1 Tax=Methanococcus maripaludis TaxID=39152 RepID=A0A8T4H7M7_METMI|nr:DUF2202 domain-containing protein [Methanococcus maripaludis]MBM7409938.1 hypothetical protein [Methanococcus maripaludis]MBP2219268.1 hypothetical protein [Methanococcus maripaludis]